MMKDVRLWIAAAGFAVAAWLLAPQWLVSRPPRVAIEDLPVTEYICRETKEVFRLPATAPALTNPKTGKTTLVPALYDPRSRNWKPGPPLDPRHATRKRRA